ncbi:hypothetical protein NQ176_g7613 [Zarea fungicola]|uniref:Uncharacterized protein n=1 Tax=Zarea fungicola TaxID=93591 RepID=A0ACC1MZI1_9HYPO|nr:hypothetical protein NQ176_g7613 [Lecanicillium fungicola]
MADSPAFTHHPSVADFAVPKHGYLAIRPSASFGYIATSTLVVETGLATSGDPRVLLLQRAASDVMPNKWEPPGGACDDDDPSILAGAARELLEEAGLEALHIAGQVGAPYFFTVEDGKRVCQFNFAVRVRTNNEDTAAIWPPVKLNPEEHQRFLWATKSEVEANRAGDIDLDFTREEVRQTVLQAFDHHK